MLSKMTRADLMGALDVLYFLAELASYLAVGWFGLTRHLPLAARILVAASGVILFATTWALFAAPNDPKWPLHGAADTAFRLAWFGLALGAACAAAVRIHHS